MKAISKSWILALGASSLAIASSAHAADTTPADKAPAPAGTQAAPATEPQAGLQDIVVIANRRQESIQSVPIAIDVVRADTLAASGVSDTLQLTTVIPGLQFQTSQNGMNVHLRGVGISTIPPGNENSVATYVDGVYIANLSGGFMALNNIEQVEVDKGPQGTLFGRNATGGVVNITTRNPSHTFGGSASVTYGNYNTVGGDGYVTAGLSNNLAADIAVHYSHQFDGYGTNLFTGKDVQKTSNLAVRSKWLFTPTDRDKAVLAFDYEYTDSTVYDSFQLVPGASSNWGPGAPEPRGTPYTFTGGPWDVNVPIQPAYTNRQGGVSLTLNHDFDFAQLTSITAYRQAKKTSAWSVEPIPTDAQVAYWTIRDRQVTQELQLSSSSASGIKWVAGLFYMHGATELDPLITFGSVATVAPLQQIYFYTKETTDNGAAFGQVTVPLSFLGATHLTAGLRYTVERRGIDGFQRLDYVAPTPSVVRGQTDTDTTFRKLTWRLSLDHRFSDQVMAYVSYNRGFKSGVYGTIPATAVPVEPEVLDAYEGGIKTDLFDRHLRINLAGFYYDYKDLQVSVSNRTSVVLQNGAHAKIYGIDADLEAKLGDLQLTAGVEALHDEFTSFDGVVFFVPQTVAQGGGNLQVVGSAKGNKLPNTPNITFNVGVHYDVPIGYGRVKLSTTYAYMGRWFQGPDNILSSPASNLVNAQIGWTSPDDKTSVTFWVNNLTNQVVPMFLQAAGNPGGYSEQVNQPPRTLGVTLKQNF